MKTLQNNPPNASATKEEGQQPSPFILFPKDTIPHLEQVADYFAADPLLVATAACAVAGAGLGSNIRVQMPGRQMPPAFNLAIASPGRRRLPWLDYLASPLSTYVRKKLLAENRTPVSEQVLKTKLKKIDEQLRTVDSTRTSQQTDMLHRDRADVLAALKPLILAGTCSPAQLTASAIHSFDQSVLVATGSLDLLAEMREFKNREATQLAQLLTASWDGQCEHCISLLQSFSAEAKDLQCLLINRPNFPLLILGEESASRSTPTQALDPLKGWPDLVARKAILRRLAAIHKPVSVSRTPEAEQLLEDFTQEIDLKLKQLPTAMHQHLNWLPDLTARLAAILEILHRKDNILPATLATRAEEFNSVITYFARPLLARCLSSWQKLISDPSVKLAADTHDATDNERRILEKVTENPGINQRKLQRSFDSMSAGERNAAVDTLIGRDLIRVEGKSLFVV